jgi:hypothetical protein
MNTHRKIEPSKEGKALLKTLQQTITKTLERKRRLGQYFVIWKDGKVVITGADAPRNDDRAN